MTGTWTWALARRRPARILGPAAAVAIAVALLSVLILFLVAAKASMTQRAGAGVAVDWQVQVQPGADPTAVLQAVARAPGTMTALAVSFARVSGLRSTVAGTTQTTGSGVVLGLPDRYRQWFPTVLRPLSGADTGVLVAQQAAKSLHVAPGDAVIVLVADTPHVLRVDGVVDLPSADSLFQTVGAPSGASPAAPPDNVVLVPQKVFDRWWPTPDGTASYVQIHARRSHSLPHDPAAAYAVESSSARNLEATTSGAGLVMDNLGATLGAARSDALYAQAQFLFLGTPGTLLAGLLTAVIAAAAAGSRRREHAALRTRGASLGQLTRLVGSEAVAVVLVGAGVGLASAALLGHVILGITASAVTPAELAVGLVLALGVAAAITVLTLIAPARHDLRTLTVTASARSDPRRQRAPAWARFGVDFLLLAASLVLFRITSRGGYALVLAPEGVPTISVSYWALIAPALLWAGIGLLAWRLVDLGLRRGRRPIAALARPMAGPLATTVAAALSRRRRTVTQAVALLTLALAFAISTASFNAKYRQQAEVDAALTNGADVTVTFAPGITSARGIAESSLTGVDLSGLTRVELGFALVLATASGGLVLWLGMAERRRTFAIVGLLGGRRRHIAGFVAVEALLVLMCGALGGIVAGWALTRMLIVVLSGVFDPPPASVDYPLPYLAALAAATVASIVVAAAASIRSALRTDVSILRTNEGL